MPIDKYNERNLNNMRELVSIDSAMFIPKLDNIFGPDRLVRGDMLQYIYGIPAFPEMRGMHSTLAMTMALDSVKRCHHNDTPIFHMPYEPITFDYIDVYEKYNHITANLSICLPKNDFNISDVIKHNVNNFKELPYLYIDSYIDDDYWSTPISRYDEEKVKAYKIPSNDRLEMLTRIYKLIKGNKK